MRRRTVLAGVATLPALAGCLSDGDDGPVDDATDDGTDDDPGDDAGDGAPDDGSDTGGDDGATDGSGGDGRQAATNALDVHPSLGAAPGTTDWLIVAFEDPACPTCAGFHTGDLPDLRSELLDPGDATYVWRPYRFVSQHYPWNSEAMHAVYEAVDRDEAAAWALIDHYYEHQDDVSTSNVADQTRTALSGTGVDADAVVTAMEEGAHSGRLSRSERDAEEAGVTSTPTFFLFDGDEHVTTRHRSLSPTEVRAAFQS